MSERVLLVGHGPTAGDAMESLAQEFEIIGLVRPGEDDVTHRAKELGIPVTDAATVGELDALVGRLDPDAVVVSSYGRVLPARTLERCPFVNVHYAPLPHGRGRANVNWAIINGDSHTAITVHTMAPGLDAGRVLYQEALPIGPRDNVGDLYGRLNARQRAVLAGAVRRHLDGYEGEVQDETAATYGCTRIDADGELDWSAPTVTVDRLIRALAPPYPGAFTWLGLERVRVLRAEPSPDGRVWSGRVPGRVVARSGQQGWADVMTGDGVMRLWELEDEDGRVVEAAELLRSVRTTLGLRTGDLVAVLRSLGAGN